MVLNSGLGCSLGCNRRTRSWTRMAAVAFPQVSKDVRERGVEPLPPKGPGPKPGVSTVSPLARRVESSVLTRLDTDT
jgi:hypothetical protein